MKARGAFVITITSLKLNKETVVLRRGAVISDLDETLGPRYSLNVRMITSLESTYKMTKRLPELPMLLSRLNELNGGCEKIFYQNRDHVEAI